MATPPACVSSCLNTYLGEAHCDISDLRNCYCGNHTLQSNVADCVVKLCSSIDQAVGVQLQQQTCAGLPIQNRQIFLLAPLLTLSIIFWIIVGLRCLVRWKITQKFWWDDYSMLFGVACQVVLAVIDYELVSHGVGKHAWDIDLADVPFLYVMFYLINIFYVLNLVVIKLSIVFLYLRIFEDRNFRRLCWATQILMATLFFVFALLLALRCSPVSAGWQRPGTNPNAQCVDYNAVVVGGAATNIFTDVWILLLPVRQLLKLSMDKSKKIQIMLMFNIGLLACATSCVRLKFVNDFQIDSADPTYDDVNLIYWSTLELGVAYLCANLPSVRPLLRIIAPKTFGFSANVSTPSHSRNATSSWLSDSKRKSKDTQKFERVPSPQDPFFEPEPLLESCNYRTKHLSAGNSKKASFTSSSAASNWPLDGTELSDLDKMEPVVIRDEEYGKAV